MFLEVESLDEIKKKLDKFYMLMIFRAMHPNFEHVKDQVLTGHEVSSKEDLTTRLHRVPTLQSRNVQEPVESFVMVSAHGREGCNARHECSGRGRPQ